ncbi:bifunctional oligoribonuclease/PAP phosphatase NrnA [Patescibacteria group bacterium]|nr:bifunctional oligoribonuclease/PAP phosphatase NrnA [Patescibacteria group bacterium]MBU1705268.1 bifunctional oligoribonuclease/PAP phosphatase NrnA [Patescibacteria group bacterium]
MQSYIHRQIHEELLKAKHPVLISDERIDGDSLGSSLAMADYLKRLGHDIQVYVPKPVPEQYHKLPLMDLCTDDQAIFQNADIDLVAVFDCSDPDYVSRLVEQIPRSVKVINIDHHATNPGYGDINQVVATAPAASQIVFDFYQENKIIPSRDAATLMLMGICSDTGVFTNGATNAGSLDAGSELILRGAQVQDIIRLLFRNRSVEALRIWGAALGRLVEHQPTGFVWTFLTKQDMESSGVSEEEIGGLSNFLSLVTDVDTLIVFRDSIEGGVKVSMRTRSGNVAEIATAFGGGGHIKAAGFSLDNSYLTLKDETWGIVQDGQYATIEELFKVKVPHLFK